MGDALLIDGTSKRKKERYEVSKKPMPEIISVRV
jgi:hypothetical protein